ncbi:MAG: transposase, partial [Beggiatoa sp.]|nr:transposase [Beggiatoa sp.]
CRYITRPAIANERLTRNRAGDVVLQLKSPYHDGTTHIVMSPLELMQRLAALVPRPRLHLIRFHGVLAPHAKLRPEIIPSSGHQSPFSRGGHIPVPGFPSVPVNTNTPADHAEAPPAAASVRLSWARLLKRVFEIDIQQCPQCGGTLKLIAAIEDPPVIAKILTHLGLSARAPPRSPGGHSTDPKWPSMRAPLSSPGARSFLNLLWPVFLHMCREGLRPIGSALSYQYSSSIMHVVWLAGLSEACRQKCLPQPSIRVGMGRSPHAAYAQRVK